MKASKVVGNPSKDDSQPFEITGRDQAGFGEDDLL